MDGTCHLKKKNRSGERRADNGGEIARHAQQKKRRDQFRFQPEKLHRADAVRAADQSAEDEQREKDPARRAGTEAEKRKEEFAHQQEQQNLQHIIPCRRLFHQVVTGAEQGGRAQRQNARREKGDQQADKDRKAALVLQKADHGHRGAVVERAQHAEQQAQRYHQKIKHRREIRLGGELEHRPHAKHLHGNEIGGEHRRHKRKKELGRKGVVKLFQAEQHARRGGMERRRQTGAGSAADQDALVLAVPPQKTGQPLSRHGSHLDRRPLPTERQPAQQAQKAARELAQQHGEPGAFDFAVQLTFQLWDSASSDERLTAYQQRGQPSQPDQNKKPERRPSRAFSDECQRVAQRVRGKLKAQAVQRRNASRENSRRKSRAGQKRPAFRKPRPDTRALVHVRFLPIRIFFLIIPSFRHGGKKGNGAGALGQKAALLVGNC